MKRKFLLIFLSLSLAIAVGSSMAFAYDANDIFNLLSDINNLTWAPQYRYVVNINDNIISLNSNMVNNFLLIQRALNYTQGVSNENSVGAMLSRLEEYLVDDSLKDAKDDYASRSAIVADEFLGSGGSASASLSDFGDVASGLSSLNSGFSGGASSGRVFDVMSGNSDAWGYFSNAVKNDLDGTSQRVQNNRRSSDDISNYPLLSERFSSLSDFLVLENSR